LALFYAHAYQIQGASFKGMWALVLHAATDHILEMDIPSNLPPKLRERVEKFRERALAHRYEADDETAQELFKECLEILKEIDGEVFGLEVVVKYP
jgi:vacuolar-type H+-ATPase catalytic subunit A/Vma1